MEFFAFALWVGLAVGIGAWAKSLNRSPGAWFALSLVLSPLIGGIALLFMGEGEPEHVYQPASRRQAPSEPHSSRATYSRGGLRLDDPANPSPFMPTSQMSKCGHINLTTAMECEKCGASLLELPLGSTEKTCPDCAEISKAAARICWKCHYEFKKVDAPAPATNQRLASISVDVQLCPTCGIPQNPTERFCRCGHDFEVVA